MVVEALSIDSRNLRRVHIAHLIGSHERIGRHLVRSLNDFVMFLRADDMVMEKKDGQGQRRQHQAEQQTLMEQRANACPGGDQENGLR